ncbi:MAG: GTPase [Promethearchaeota archaeon]
MTKLKFSYPRGNFPRLCLIGNSNVGKSSITRFLLSHPKWYKSKIGKTPGSTVRLTIINDPGLNHHIIDLPGFGRMVRLDRKSQGFVQDQILHYVERDKKNIFLMLIVVSIDRLDDELEKYFFQNPDTIPLTIELIQFMQQHQIPSAIVLNKMDKLNIYKIKAVKEKLLHVLNEFNLDLDNGDQPNGGQTKIFTISAKKQKNIKELKLYIKEQSDKLDLSKYDSRDRLRESPPTKKKKKKKT